MANKWQVQALELYTDIYIMLIILPTKQLSLSVCLCVYINTSDKTALCVGVFVCVH